MFWETVVAGLRMLGHWEVLVSLALYTVFQLVWLYISGLLSEIRSPGGQFGAGCMNMVIGYLAQSVILGVLVFYLTPLIMGHDRAMQLDLIGHFAWPIAKASLFSAIALVLIAFVPLVGGLVGQTPGLPDFVQAVVIFRLLSASMIEPQLQEMGARTEGMYPGFWACGGYFLVAAALGALGMLVLGILGITVGKGKLDPDSGAAFLIAKPMMQLVVMLPFFMYASHVNVFFAHGGS